MFITRITIGLLIAISCTASYAFDFTNYTPKLLALGDSITEGNGSKSYRCHLKELAEQSSNVHFDYIGSRSGPECNDSGDYEHEGWGGRTAPEVIWNEKHSGSNQSLLEYSLAQETPDIVLIHLGTNDLIQTNSNNLNSTITEAIDAISDGISMIRDNNPDAIILLAKILPLYYSNSAHQRVPPFNDAILQLGDSLNTTNSPVIIVDQYSGITSSNLYDGVHPTPAGENKMAQKWFDALKPFFKKPKDTIAPEISLYGDNPVRIARGSEYNDAGAIAEDNQDGELTVKIDDSSVNTNKKGSYIVRFSALDAAGNKANITRTVNVYIPDTTPPSITLNGKKTVSSIIGSDYTDAGAHATDNVDGDRFVTIDSSAVNTNEAGIY
jgi:lysophospholipase L1-like esterase